MPSFSELSSPKHTFFPLKIRSWIFVFQHLYEEEFLISVYVMERSATNNHPVSAKQPIYPHTHWFFVSVQHIDTVTHSNINTDHLFSHNDGHIDPSLVLMARAGAWLGAEWAKTWCVQASVTDSTAALGLKQTHCVLFTAAFLWTPLMYTHLKHSPYDFYCFGKTNKKEVFGQSFPC